MFIQENKENLAFDISCCLDLNLQRILRKQYLAIQILLSNLLDLHTTILQDYYSTILLLGILYINMGYSSIVCSRGVRKNSKALECEECKEWCHIIILLTCILIELEYFTSCCIIIIL